MAAANDTTMAMLAYARAHRCQHKPSRCCQHTAAQVDQTLPEAKAGQLLRQPPCCRSRLWQQRTLTQPGWAARAAPAVVAVKPSRGNRRHRRHRRTAPVRASPAAPPATVKPGGRSPPMMGNTAVAEPSVHPTHVPSEPGPAVAAANPRHAKTPGKEIQRPRVRIQTRMAGGNRRRHGRRRHSRHQIEHHGGEKKGEEEGGGAPPPPSSWSRGLLAAAQAMRRKGGGAGRDGGAGRWVPPEPPREGATRGTDSTSKKYYNLKITSILSNCRYFEVQISCMFDAYVLITDILKYKYM
jgi:hypothetical protein